MSLQELSLHASAGVFPACLPLQEPSLHVCLCSLILEQRWGKLQLQTPQKCNDWETRMTSILIALTLKTETLTPTLSGNSNGQWQ